MESPQRRRSTDASGIHSFRNIRQEATGAPIRHVSSTTNFFILAVSLSGYSRYDNSLRNYRATGGWCETKTAQVLRSMSMGPPWCNLTLVCNLDGCTNGASL